LATLPFLPSCEYIQLETFAERKSRDSSIGSHYFVSHEIEHRGFQFRSSMRGFCLASSNVAKALSAIAHDRIAVAGIRWLR
jgi:hypothetical protein